MSPLIKIFLVLFFLSSCKYGAYIKSVFSKEPQVFEVNQKSLIDRVFYQALNNPDSASPIVLFIGGSGFTSYKWYLNDYFSTWKSPIMLFAIQKLGIKKFSNELLSKPNNQFLKHNFFGQWVADYSEFLGLAKELGIFKNRKIIVMGVSEGGLLASYLGKNFELIDMVILCNSGLMETKEELQLIANKNGFKGSIQPIFNQISDDSISYEKYFMGQTYKYWYSLFNQSSFNYLNKLKKPILIVHGTKDANCPIESADLVYKLENKVDYYRINEMDHFYNKESRSIKNQVFDSIEKWVLRNINNQ